QDGADSLAILLKSEGVEVSTVYSAGDALQALDKGKFTVAILDIGLPGINGLEFAQRIRAQSEFDEMRLIALTAWGRDADVERSREAGFAQHLVKPPDFGVLHPLLAPRP